MGIIGRSGEGCDRRLEVTEAIFGLDFAIVNPESA